jgi:hypothetical protein
MPEGTSQVEERAAGQGGTIKRRFVCTKKCYHFLHHGNNRRKIYLPGDEYFAVPGEGVPKHFKEVA